MSRDPRVSVCAKILIGIVAAYALSPIDLIPDFVPVIGYLEDLNRSDVNDLKRAVDRNLASWIGETIIDLSKWKNDMTIACSRTKLPRCACSLAADAGRYAYEQSGKNVSVIKDLVSYARIEVR